MMVHGGGSTHRHELTVGSDEACDIWLSHPTVSALHATIKQRAGSGHDPTPPGFTLRDCRSKNGVRVSTWGPDGPFVRVPMACLDVGLYVKLGAVVLVAADRAGVCPVVASNEADFIAEATALYGSEQAAARIIGHPARPARGILSRIFARAAKP